MRGGPQDVLVGWFTDSLGRLAQARRGLALVGEGKAIEVLPRFSPQPSRLYRIAG
jgi:hypothetical protein